MKRNEMSALFTVIYLDVDVSQKRLWTLNVNSDWNRIRTMHHHRWLPVLVTVLL